MKKVKFSFGKRILRGLLDGSLQLVAVPTGKKPKKFMELKNRANGKPGRKALSKAEKTKRLREKARAIKSQLPSARDICVYMIDKRDGATVTDIAQNFKLSRSLLKDLIDKMVKKEELQTFKGKLFLRKRLRNVGEKVDRPKPVSSKQILDYLKKHPKSTLADMAEKMGESGYQRFIRPMRKLEDEGKVVRDGRAYKIA
jgi:polyhydroxyalkanoate synthesis regulator phasin